MSKTLKNKKRSTKRRSTKRISTKRRNTNNKMKKMRGGALANIIIMYETTLGIFRNLTYEGVDIDTVTLFELKLMFLKDMPAQYKTMPKYSPNNFNEKSFRFGGGLDKEIDDNDNMSLRANNFQEGRNTVYIVLKQVRTN